MAYLGILPSVGAFRKVDDISSQFNGVDTIFVLTEGGNAFIIGNAQNLIISIDGVIQEPGVAYTVNGSSVTFTEAPASGSSFFGVQLGSVHSFGTVSEEAIITSKLAANAVTTAKIAESAITTARLNDNAVTTAKIAESAITTARIDNLAVTSGKIAGGAVGASKLDTDAVTTGAILANAVTTAKIAEGAITEARIDTGSVTNSKIGSGAVTSSKLGGNLTFDGLVTFLDGSLETANIISSAPLTVSNVNLFDGGIHYYTADSTANGAITINVNGLASSAVGNVASVAVMLTNNATFNAYISAFRIDNVNANILRWQGSNPPSAGSANIDVYSFSIFKTAAGTYTVLGSKANFN